MPTHDELVNRFNLNDSSLLNGVRGLTTVTISGRTFVLGASSNANSVVVYEALPGGQLTFISSFDDDAAINMNSPQNIVTTEIGGATYVYVNSFYGDAIQIFTLAADGTLAFVQEVVDSASTEFSGTEGEMTIIDVSGALYLVAGGNDDNGITSFRIGADGRLSERSSLDDADDTAYGLGGATSIASVSFGTTTLLYVASYDEDAIAVISIDAAGNLNHLGAVYDSDNNNYELNGVYALETVRIDGKTYLIAAGFQDAGISIFRARPDGSLTNVTNIADTAQLGLYGVTELDVFEFDGRCFVAAVGQYDDAASYFELGSDGSLSVVDTVFDDVELNLDNAVDVTTMVINDRVFLVTSSNNEDGLSVFEVGVSSDTIEGTSNDDVIVGTQLDDTIEALRGNDVVLSEDGDDTVIGGDGDDILQGGAGNDILIGDENEVQTDFDTTTIPSTDQELSISLTLPADSSSGTIDIEGFISRVPVQGNEFNIVYVVDVSSSMASQFSGAETVGDINGNNSSDELIDGTILAFEAVHQSIIDAGLGGSDVGIVTFNSAAGLVYSGSASGDVSGTLRSLTASGNTDFEAALQETISYLQGAGTGENRIFFISDGANNGGSTAFADEVATLLDENGLNAEIRAIGLGNNANLDQLDLLDDGIDNDSSERVVTPSTLTALLSGTPVETSEVAHLEILVNGTVVRTLFPDEFEVTPLGLRYEASISGLNVDADDVITARLVASDPASTMATVSIVLDNSAQASGDDVLIGGEGSDELRGGGGADTLIGDAGNDRLLGGTGTDTLIGGEGNDRLEGGGGVDILNGGEGEDVIDGGGGMDIVNYSGSTARVVVNLGSQQAIGGDADGDHLSSIEGVTGTVYRDTLLGSAGDNILEGGDESDLLDGREGNDTLRGDNGNDILKGGGGDDILSGGDGEDLIFAGSGNDTVFGGDGFDRIYGGAGDDQIYAGSSNDIVNAGDGADVINGGSGNDLIYGQAGSDNIFGADGNDKLYGGDGNDILSGGSGGDRLYSGQGNDAIFGGGGSDLIYFDAGDDKLYGGSGADRFVIFADQGADHLFDYTSADILDISGFGLTDGAGSDTDWLVATTSVISVGGGADTLITWDGGGTLRIENTTVAQLMDDDFIFF
ncbi:VWA domain-containing protein [Roseibium sp. M-1]